MKEASNMVILVVSGIKQRSPRPSPATTHSSPNLLLNTLTISWDADSVATNVPRGAIGIQTAHQLYHTPLCSCPAVR